MLVATNNQKLDCNIIKYCKKCKKYIFATHLFWLMENYCWIHRKSTKFRCCVGFGFFQLQQVLHVFLHVLRMYEEILQYRAYLEQFLLLSLQLLVLPPLLPPVLPIGYYRNILKSENIDQHSMIIHTTTFSTCFFACLFHVGPIWGTITISSPTAAAAIVILAIASIATSITSSIT